MSKSEKKSQSFPNKSLFENIDWFLPLLLLLSLINPIRAALHQYYLLAYQDDITWVYWISQSIEQPLSILSHGPLAGYRITINLLYALGYSLWGANETGYYLLSGILFAGSMLFFYLLVKSLSNKPAAIIATLLYLFLDSSFILVWKFNFITFTSELFFMTASLYYLIRFYQLGRKKDLFIAIPLAVLAFFSKEPSILIIPTVSFLYLTQNWHNLKLDANMKKLMLFITTLPVLALLYILASVQTNVGPSSSGQILDLLATRLNFYIHNELSWQLKNPYLLILAGIATFYFHRFEKKEVFGFQITDVKNVASVFLMVVSFVLFSIFEVYSTLFSVSIVLFLCICFYFATSSHRIGIAWFLSGLSPLLVTSIDTQPTYLAEPSLGICLFIGVSMSQYFMCAYSMLTGRIDVSHFYGDFPSKPSFSKYMSKILIVIFVLVMLFQLSQVPVQIENTNNYHKIISDRQISFKEAVEYIVNEVPYNGTIYYISDEKRQEAGGGQISPSDLYQLLCLKGRCDIQIESLETLNSNLDDSDTEGFIVLLSSLDIYILNDQYPQLLDQIKDSQANIINNGDAHAAVVVL